MVHGLHFFPCNDGRCYWVGYQDAQGNELHFSRGLNLELQRLDTKDKQGIEFQSDRQQRIVDGVERRATMSRTPTVKTVAWPRSIAPMAKSRCTHMMRTPT